MKSSIQMAIQVLRKHSRIKGASSEMEGAMDAEGPGHLPDEVLRLIFQLLPVKTLLACEQVCARWKNVVLNKGLWKRHLVVHSENQKHNKNNLSLISTHGEYISLLKLQYVENYNTIRDILKKCKNVISLQLVRCNLTKAFENDITMCPKLKKLDLNTSIYLDDEPMEIPFDRFRYLSYVSLCDFGLGSSNCDTLLRCHYLTHIYIEKIKRLELEYVKRLISCRQSSLVALHLHGGASVDDSCLYLLSLCHDLKDIAIAECWCISDTGMLALSKLSTLEHLKLSYNCTFTETCLLSVFKNKNFQYLKSLDLSGVEHVSCNVVYAIAEFCQNLKRINLVTCPKLVGCSRQLDIILRNVTVALY